MDIPPRAQEIIDALYERHKDLARGNDDDRRKLTLMIAQQCAFEFGLNWGTKSADRTRPPSKDGIAYLESHDLIHGWDWQNGGTREPLHPPTYHDISDQHFIDVKPINHLNVEVVVQPAPDTPAPAPAPVPDPTKGIAETFAVLEQRLEAIETHMRAIDVWTSATADGVDKLLHRPEVPAWPAYEGKLLGITVVLRPK